MGEPTTVAGMECRDLTAEERVKVERVGRAMRASGSILDTPRPAASAWEVDPWLPNERVRAAIWHGLGWPSRWAGAARVGRAERAAVVAALFAALGLSL